MQMLCCTSSIMPQTSAAMMGYGIASSSISASSTLENIAATAPTTSTVMAPHHSLFVNLAAAANETVLCPPSTSSEILIPTGNFNYDHFTTHSMIDTTNSTLCHSNTGSVSNTTTSSSSGCSLTPHAALALSSTQDDSDMLRREASSIPGSPLLRTTTPHNNLLNHDNQKLRQPLLAIPAFFNSQVIKPFNQNDIVDNCNQNISNITELSSASSSTDSSLSFCFGANNNANDVVDAASTAAMLAAAAAAGQQRSYWMPQSQMINSVAAAAASQQSNQYGYNPQQFPFLFTPTTGVNSINDWSMINMTTPIHASQINSQHYNYLFGNTDLSDHQGQSQQLFLQHQQQLTVSNEQLIQHQHQLQLQHQQQQHQQQLMLHQQSIAAAAMSEHIQPHQYENIYSLHSQHQTTKSELLKSSISPNQASETPALLTAGRTTSAATQHLIQVKISIF